MTAVVDARRSLTFTELMQEAGRMAALMRSFGFQAGDRVAVLSQNRWELAALFFAAASIDAVVVPLNGRLSLPELRWILADAEPLKWDDWLSLSGMPKSSFGRYVTETLKSGQIIKENGVYRIRS